MDDDVTVLIDLSKRIYVRIEFLFLSAKYEYEHEYNCAHPYVVLSSYYELLNIFFSFLPLNSSQLEFKSTSTFQ